MGHTHNILVKIKKAVSQTVLVLQRTTQTEFCHTWCSSGVTALDIFTISVDVSVLTYVRLLLQTTSCSCFHQYLMTMTAQIKMNRLYSFESRNMSLNRLVWKFQNRIRKVTAWSNKRILHIAPRSEDKHFIDRKVLLFQETSQLKENMLGCEFV